MCQEALLGNSILVNVVIVTFIIKKIVEDQPLCVSCTLLLLPK
jgi:hypothetical protein